MKNFICLLCATILGSAVSFGQPNNPNNRLGADIVAAGAVVSKDYKDGKIKDLDQATIDRYYNTLLPGYEKVKLADATKVINAMKGASSQSAIRNSGFSAAGQAFLQKSLTDYSQTALADDVNKSNLPAAEKNTILTVIAINYNLIPKTAFKAGGKGKGPSAQFDIDFDDSQFSSSPQVAVWASIGALMGFNMCGPWCAVFGGILGIIIGSMPGTTTVTPSGGGGSHSYTSGGPHP